MSDPLTVTLLLIAAVHIPALLLKIHQKSKECERHKGMAEFYQNLTKELNAALDKANATNQTLLNLRTKEGGDAK